MEKAKTPSEPPKPNFQQYEDPSGDFDSQELKWSLWYVRNKVLLYRIAVGLLIVLSAVEWLYSLGSFGAFAIFGWQADQKIQQSLANFVDYTAFHPHITPQQLSVVSTQVLPGGVDKYDAVSEIMNPNEHFLVSFDYYFKVGGVETDHKHTQLLPLEDRLLPVYGISSSQYPGDAALVIENMQWQRVSEHTVTDPKSWQADRLRFEVKNLAYTPADSIEGVKANIISFDYFNNTAFSYAEPSFVVGLYYHNTLVGVTPLTLPSFTTFETKQVDVRTLVNNLQVDEVRVYPVINVYDQAAYLPPPS